MSWVIALCVVLAVALLLLLHILSVRKHQAMLVRKLRGTELYGHLYPLMLRFARRPVEQVVIRNESLTILPLAPEERTVCYVFDRHGYDSLEPDVTYALAQAVMVDMRVLRDTERYRFNAHKEIRPNGSKTMWYEYIIRTEYKDKMLQAMQRSVRRPA